MRILLWHLHGSWTTAFVQGPHEYLLPVTPDRGPYGLGRARTWDWPPGARDVPVQRLRDEDFDVVIVQRPHEIQLVREWIGRRAGIDVPALYLEHNSPKGEVPFTRHPAADLDRIPIVHVTHTNALMWDNGRATVHVIEHGIIDPGERFTGELPRGAVVVNEPVRRGRVTGTDLLADFSTAAPLDVYGMKLDGLHERYGCDPERVALHPDVGQDELHTQIAKRRVYVHPIRWTSLGLSLIEAMHVGMPVVAVAATEVPRAVPPEAGCVSASREELTAAIRDFTHDLDAARIAGKAARTAALERYGLERFLRDWDRLLQDVTR